MSNDIRTLTTRLAEEPASLAFLELGEALRRRGQLEAAYKVARGGLGRYPGLAEAHDLLARILGDQGDLAGAFDAWAEALRVDPMRTSALKGIAFLYYRAGNLTEAREHLQRAADIDPDDHSIAAALERMKPEVSPAGAPAAVPAANGSAVPIR
ncbi:MAG TPA: tetratricopeptide repeat protein, partial [Gemmatimonadales bacterium]|nr:tetratricopeptide repeat protein [Gemmatimonadales bacterium]